MRRRAMLGTALLSALAPWASAHAQAWPSKPIRLVVGYAPGGTTDILARLVAPHLAAALGQPVVVENRPGAGGNVGTAAVARADPDGYSLVMGTGGTLTINPAIYAQMPFDPQKDLAPVSLIAAVQNVMVVNAALPVRSVAEFIAYAKQRPGQVFFASSSVGSASHVAGELLNILAGVQMVHVPYRGSAPALADLVAGHGVQVTLDNLPAFIGAIQDGRLRALAVTGANRSPVLPDVPTMQEAGVRDFEVTTVFGLLTTGGTPPEIVARLHRETVAAVRRPEITQRIKDLGAEPVASTPAEFAAVIARDIATWRDVVRRAAIQPI
ncbi:Bug family tripartite tricarboxylate transporter substrate binding protein [Elioraea sp.]|jgi:tripartite-type tricarboxylate transporter receptor subunit TctC|uniref:Bug family tripartite tricarboxylate transporter substrate binding protein n=1 Tax=Elioraea sp. TaxID=2185103 RepID=UPI003F70E1A5